MTDNMRLLLSLSLSGAILVLVLLATRPWLQRRVSKSFQYYIWAIVLLRFCLPVTSDVNLMDALFFREKSAPTSTLSQQPIPGVQEAQAQPALIASDEAKNTAERPSSESRVAAFLLQTLRRLDVGLCIWGLGAAGFLAWNIATYRRYAKALRSVSRCATESDMAVLTELCVAQGIKRTPTLLQANAVQTPMLIGFRQPCILLPEGEFEPEQLSNILLHELMHLRRHDIAMKWAVTMVCALHWFNPIVHVMRREINRACELACDEAVIRSMNDEEKQRYGETLIASIASSRRPISFIGTMLGAEKHTMKERLIAIMEHNGLGRQGAICAFALAVILMAVALFLGACFKTTEQLNPTENANSDDVTDFDAFVKKLKDPEKDFAFDFEINGDEAAIRMEYADGRRELESIPLSVFISEGLSAWSWGDKESGFVYDGKYRDDIVEKARNEIEQTFGISVPTHIQTEARYIAASRDQVFVSFFETTPSEPLYHAGFIDYDFSMGKGKINQVSIWSKSEPFPDEKAPVSQEEWDSCEQAVRTFTKKNGLAFEKVASIERHTYDYQVVTWVGETDVITYAVTPEFEVRGTTVH